MKNKLRNFVSSATDTDEKYFRQAIWQYVQSERQPDFQGFLIGLVSAKTNQSNSALFVAKTSKGDEIINKDFYAWATDVRNSLQKLVK